MREVKFRAWIGELSKWADSVCVYNDSSWYAELDNIGGYGEDGGGVLVQYTGLKDKNGVDIYEGDVVDCYWLAELGVCEIDCQYKGVVRFVDCRFEISFPDKAFIRNIGDDGIYSATELELTYMSHDDDFAVEYEVIGNIYENPELLESDNE